MPTCRKTWFVIFVAVAMTGWLLVAAPSSTIADDAAGLEFFEKKIRPVLVEHCYQCHSAQAKEVQGELLLDTRAAIRQGGPSGPAVVPTKPDASLILKALRYTTDFYQMPPDKKLAPEIVADFVKWIEIGAPDPRTETATVAVKSGRRDIDLNAARKMWAFQIPARSPLPNVSNPALSRSPLDHFIVAKLDAAGLSPVSAAEKRTLIRRVTYDLTGLPPTPDEIADFLSDDSPNSFSRLTERLLASPRYGERWGRHWLDVARFADSNGLDENLAYSNAFRYRDYVIDAFNRDKPFDHFVHEQLAGDLLPPIAGEPEAARHERLVATGFLAIGPKMLACDDGRKMELDIIDEQVDTTCRAFLGMTMGCARCHDHKFDPFSQRDYYSLAGIFKSTKTMENFNVVAVWHEHSLATAEEETATKAHTERIKAAEQQVKERTTAAQEEFLTTERARAGDYFLKALEFVSANGTTELPKSAPRGEQLQPEQLAGRGVLFEAEKFARGTLQIDTTNWGKGIGVLLQNGFAEYDLDLPAAGQYQLELRYAAQDSRPLELSLNGTLVKLDAAAEVTGGWYPNAQRWHVEGLFNLPAGKNVLRLERTGVVPHVDKILLLLVKSADTPTQPSTVPKPVAAKAKQSASPENIKAASQAAKLNEELLKQWIGFLGSGAARDEVLKTWRTADEAQRPDIARQLADQFTAAHTNAAMEPFHRILFDRAGPYQLPKKPERFYSEAAKADLKQLTTAKTDLEKNRPTISLAMGVREGKIENLPIHIRGNYLTLGEPTERGLPAIFPADSLPAFDKQASGRLQFANWLTSPTNPLTARVMANRLWLWHFGQGLVRSPDNFGSLGDPPTHPELLDWLATEFRGLARPDSAWSMKALQREIVLSATYQTSSQFNPAAHAKDPENRLWWHRPRRRLEAEAIRDAMLVMGGQLDLTQHGQLLKYKNREYVTGTGSLSNAYDFARRSVYVPILRSSVYDVLTAFDFGDPSVIQGQRPTTTVAPQALFAMNDLLVTKNSRRLAEVLLAQSELNDTARVQAAYERAFGRPASDTEVSRALDFVNRYRGQLAADNVADAERSVRAWQGFCRVLMAANEMIYIE